MKKLIFGASVFFVTLSAWSAQNLPSVNSDVPQELASLTNVTTYYYELQPEEILDYMMRDIQEKRVRFSKTNPSYLDQHISYVKLKDSSFINLKKSDSNLVSEKLFVENADFSLANSVQSTQSFTSGTGSVCFSYLSLAISIAGPSSNNVSSFSRNCSVPPPSGTAPNFFANWARSTLTSTTTGLGRVLSYYGLTYEANYNSSTPNSGLRAVNFRSKTTGVGVETNGAIYFNDYGSAAVATEIVFHSTQWQ